MNYAPCFPLCFFLVPIGLSKDAVLGNLILGDPVDTEIVTSVSSDKEGIHHMSDGEKKKNSFTKRSWT